MNDPFVNEIIRRLIFYGVINMEGYMRIGTLVFCAILMFMLPTAVHAFNHEIAYGQWTQDPSGTLSYDGSLTGDVIDLEDTLNMGQRERKYLRAKLELPWFFPNVYFMAMPMSFSGSNTVPVTVNFGGQTFNVGADIESEIVMDQYDLAFYYDIPGIKQISRDIVNLELGLNIRNMNFEATLFEAISGRTEGISFSVPVSLLYIGAQIRPMHYVAAEFEARYISFNDNGYYDYITRLKIFPIKTRSLFFGAGARTQNIKLDTKGVEADIKFSGSFVEIGMEF
jgi:outer membrane protein